MSVLGWHGVNGAVTADIVAEMNEMRRGRLFSGRNGFVRKVHAVGEGARKRGPHPASQPAGQRARRLTASCVRARPRAHHHTDKTQILDTNTDSPFRSTSLENYTHSLTHF